MHPKFSIAVDPSRDFVTIVMTGLLMPADVADFFEARRKAHRQLRCAPGRHLTLADLRAMRIMPRETVEAFSALLTDTGSRARRAAFLIAPTLVRGQLLRALAGRDARCFTDPGLATTWLLEEDEAASGHRPTPNTVPLLRCVA